MMYTCDINVILRYLLNDDQKSLQKINDIFNDVQSGKTKLHLEQIVFTEVIYVLSSYYEVPKDEISAILTEFLQYKGLVTDRNLLIKALEIYSKENLHIVDCILAAKEFITSVPTLTLDQKLSTFIKNSK